MQIRKFISPVMDENCYIIVSEDKAIVIDPGFYCSKLIDMLKEDKIEVKYVLLTHTHIDHVHEVGFFNCPIYMRDQAKKNIYDSYITLYDEFEQKIPYENLNIIDFGDKEITIELLGIKIKCIPTNGHTNDSVCYLVNNKNLFSGDTMFKDGYGRTDFPTGDQKELRQSLKRLCQLDENVVVYPGHYGQTTIKDFKNNVNLI